MFRNIKSALYFPVAWYFRIFAQIKLARWKPRVVVITGSSGKTTLLHLIESQLGKKVKYSHHANSAYGIPFNILGLKRKTLKPLEWINLFLLAPFKAFGNIPREKIYIVEADADRPDEGSFLSSLLQPEVTIWVSTSRTHSMNFDSLIEAKAFETVEDAIAYEYGYFLEKTTNLSIVNADSELITRQTERTNVDVLNITKQKYLDSYDLNGNKTVFVIDGKKYEFDNLLPEGVFFSIVASKKLSEYLGFEFDPTFKNFIVPPGRNSVFKGIKYTTLVDSSYNTGFAAYTEILNMFDTIKADKKWVIIGDILEQGKEEQEEHEKLANLISKSDYEKVVLLGPRIKKYGFETIKSRYKENVVSFLSPKEVLDYLISNLNGGETILFKGARFLEGVIENLLLDPNDAAKLSRREKIWEERREKWGL